MSTMEESSNGRSPMETMEEISAAFNLIDDKKQNLHKSFLHLQSQSPSSFNLPLNWPDLDSYFTTLQSSLHSKFNHVQTCLSSSEPTTVPARPELKAFCENSDGLGLIRFIALAPDRRTILSELQDAYRCAPDAPAMVLNAAASFFSPGFEGTELPVFWKGCSFMLEALLRVQPDITIEMKDKAMQMAERWNQKVFRSGRVKAKYQKALGFLLLVEAYGLVDRFSIDEIINCVLVVFVAMNDRTINMCRRIIPANNISNMIQKLIDKEWYPTAVKFIIQLKKTDEFPPIDLLEEWKLRSMSVIEETHKKEKDLQYAITMQEIRVLKSIIRCIDENHLESEYPKDNLVEFVKKLEDEVENSKQICVNNLGLKKQPVRATVLNGQLLLKSKMSTKSKKPKGNKVQPTAERAIVTPVQNTKSIQESHLQKSDLSPDHVSDCDDSPLGSHSLKSDLSPDHGGSSVRSGPSGSNAQNASLIAGPNGSTGADIGYNFFVQQSKPSADSNSNGWIWE